MTVSEVLEKFTFDNMRVKRMRVEEIALRQEIRQMLNEAGINRETLREMVQKVIKEEVEKQIKYKLSQTNIMSMVSLNKYEVRDAFREAVKENMKSNVKISVNVEDNVL